MKVSALVALAAVIFAGSAAASSLDGLKQQAHGGPPAAARGTAHALAWIEPDGSVHLSKGIVGSFHPNTGAYCIQLQAGINANRAVPSLTPVLTGSPDNLILTMILAPSVCSKTFGIQNAIGVQTGNSDSGVFNAHDEAFTLVVP